MILILTQTFEYKTSLTLGLTSEMLSDGEAKLHS